MVPIAAAAAQPTKEKVRIMRKLLVTTTALAMTLFVGMEMARADSSTTPAVTVTGTADIANKMIGRNVYNSAGDKVGEVESALIDQDGKVRYVIVGVGGFLGLGEHLVAVPYEKLKFVNEPVAYTGTAGNTATGAGNTAANRPAATTTTGAATGTDNRPATPATNTSASSSSKWYPDHAVFNASKDELKNMPEFKYSE